MNIILRHDDQWLRFSDPVEILTARSPEEIVPCFEKMQQSGLWAAGWIAYEAASALDDALVTCAPNKSFPLLQFGLFSHGETLSHLIRPQTNYQLGGWTPSVTQDEYKDAITRIKEHIAAGETYQVNYTFRLQAPFCGDPLAFFHDLIAAQQGRYSAWIQTEDFTICSASPELFFERNNGVITSKPMKGTRARAVTTVADREVAASLNDSPKDRAENIMIVDMIRNDIGRIALTGSVKTIRQFDVEKYPTVWQLTSTVQGTVSPDSAQKISPVMRALFPCASITGAPKAKTMQIIRNLERSPRGIYTGAIGTISPDGQAQFNVAIRTAIIQNGQVEYGIGGGIVWDSNPDSEYQEALSKAAILTKQTPEFELLETMRWEDGEIYLLELHLNRLSNSADYFDFPFDPVTLRTTLQSLHFNQPTRIRLVLSQTGTVQIQTTELQTNPSAPVKLAIASSAIHSQDVFLYHKTTHRSVYEKAKADFPDADDVLLFNERGEITESCIANVVLELDGRNVTPPISCGLLAGTLRESLLDAGEIHEQVIRLDDLQRADTIWLINSVRKWRRAILCRKNTDHHAQ